MKPEKSTPNQTIYFQSHVSMKFPSIVQCFVLMIGTVACNRSIGSKNAESVQRLIQAQIDRGAEGTRTKDIDRYMSVIPEDWVLHDGEGHTVTRDDLRRGALQQWAIIEKTISISVHIDRIALQGDQAAVWTSQRWERLMHERTGAVLDDVVTTQRHEEQWRFVNGKWWCYQVKELGGEVYVNGKPYRE